MTRMGIIALCACALVSSAAAAQTPDAWKFTKEKDAEKRAAEQKAAEQEAEKKAPPKVDEKRPPAVIPAEQQPDAWKMQKERERGRDGTAAGATGGAGQSRASASTSKPKTPWRGWSDRALVSLNVGWQGASFDLRDARDLEPDIPGDRERRTLAADYAVESGVTFDLGGTVRVWKGLGAGVAVTRFEDTREVPVTGTIPHPFFFNRPRTVSGAIDGTREETAVHIDAVWVVPVKRNLQVAIFGGPTFYRVKQTVVTGYAFSESYPYDEATLTRVETDEESPSVTGFNIGADVGYYFTNTIGVGGIVRFGRASVDSRLGSLDVGGPEVGVGLRLRIPQGRSSPPPRRK